jgi:hypothetical protein
MSPERFTPVEPMTAETAAGQTFNAIIQAVWHLARSHAQRQWERRLNILRQEFVKLMGDEAFLGLESPGAWWAQMEARLRAEVEDSAYTTPPVVLSYELQEEEERDGERFDV